MDVHDIQIAPVKHVLNFILPYLTHIFNLALHYGTFPRKLLEANVRVIFKAGDKNELGNYIPISVLPILSKALEKNNLR